MVNTSGSGMHHLQVRKRIHKNLEEYPHPNPLKRFVDILVYIASFAGIILTLPQILLIWVNHQTAGVSIISWTTYTINGLIWVGYGILHKEKPLIVINSAAFLMNLAVVIGVILYGV
ncbi:MAG: PQ-loop domain-containing transporter [Candidatus Woesearchaeota archaeon]